MEYKNIVKQKKSFILFTTMMLVVVFGIYSLTIVENNLFLSNLVKLKYLTLQANIYLNDITNRLITNNYQTDLVLDDNRFELRIDSIIDQNSTIYYIIINTTDDTPIRVVKKLQK